MGKLALDRVDLVTGLYQPALIGGIRKTHNRGAATRAACVPALAYNLYARADAANHLNAEIRVFRPRIETQRKGTRRIEAQYHGFAEDQHFLLFVDGYGRKIVVRIVRRIPGDF